MNRSWNCVNVVENKQASELRRTSRSLLSEVLALQKHLSMKDQPAFVYSGTKIAFPKAYPIHSAENVFDVCILPSSFVETHNRSTQADFEDRSGATFEWPCRISAQLSSWASPMRSPSGPRM